MKMHTTINDALAKLPGPNGERFTRMLAHGTMEVELYVPKGVDHQTPHTRDELYVVARGNGTFLNGDHVHTFGPGDVMFVPAGVIHRFETFSEDFLVWVIFYGPEGGEQQ